MRIRSHLFYNIYIEMLFEKRLTHNQESTQHNTHTYTIHGPTVICCSDELSMWSSQQSENADIQYGGYRSRSFAV